MDPKELSEMLKVLSSHMRIRILLLLRERRLCAGAISRRLEASPSAASQHLRILRSAGLVTATRCGNRIHYTLNGDVLAGISATLEDLLPPLEVTEGTPTSNRDGKCRHRKE